MSENIKKQLLYFLPALQKYENLHYINIET